MTELRKQAERVYPSSYTENAEYLQDAWIQGAEWAQENSEIEELESEIRRLKDELSDMEYDKDEEIDELKKEIQLLNDQLDSAADHIQ